MHSADIAEHLLTLVAEPAVAASIVGDLLEQSAGRNQAWFWRRVLQATLSMLFRESRSGRFRVWDNVSRAYGYGVLLEAACVYPFEYAASWAHRHGFRLIWLLFVQLAVNGYLMGRFAARRSPKREIPAGLMLAILIAAVLSVICATDADFSQLPAVASVICLPAIAGSCRVRMKRIRHA